VKRSLAAWAGWLLFGLGCLALGFWLRAMAAPEWLQLDTTQNPPALRPWMVEADCYSQMARVQRILHGDGLIQRHFKAENWPHGLVPSTTAPFDYVILLLDAPLRLFTVHSLDWAGALVSPALWAALVIFWMLFPSRDFTQAGRALFIVGAAALPDLIWATACGRPRHQSLILLLLALGLTAEFERWHMVVTPRRAWSLFAGLVWGLACWTSLFEPLIVFAVIVFFNLIVRRRESLALLGGWAGVMLVALLLEGFHTFTAARLLIDPPPQYQAALINWLGTIGEVRGIHLNPSLMAQTIARTVSLLLLPYLAWVLWTRANFNRTDRLLVILTALLTVFTFLQSRWIYYSSLGELFLVVRYFQIAPTRWPRLVILGIFLLGLLNADVVRLSVAARAPANQPSLQLLQISRSIDGPGGILAPWWLSPGLLYFSGQPIVAGSSHCGISGIMASALFYNANSWVEAEKILQQRRVRWVVVFDDPTFVYPLLNTSRGILGLPFATDEDPKEEVNSTVAQTLINDNFVPTWLRLRSVTPQLKLYEYVPVKGQ
jgi:hypothetical protein